MASAGAPWSQLTQRFLPQLGAIRNSETRLKLRQSGNKQSVLEKICELRKFNLSFWEFHYYDQVLLEVGCQVADRRQIKTGSGG